MTEIVLNRCPLGYFLSKAGREEYLRRKFGDNPPEYWNSDTLDRSDPILVAMMYEDVKLYAGHCAHINIVTVPDDLKWRIDTWNNVDWVVPDISVQDA